jgi:tRNA/rRNA methyltransferase/tRNA (cytidine32/uridine32-2'-O)-methyltransferase
MPRSVLDQVAVVLFEPQDPVNIAATVRAMKNMGLGDLRLVRPVPYEPERIEGVAHDTADLVHRIRHFETLDEAIADVTFVAAYTRRRRAAKRESADARETAARLIERSAEGTVAVLFGREDAGLPNSALDRAHLVATIPTTDYASLNLAQAVLVAAYELHLAAGDATRVIGPPKHEAPPPTAEQLEQTFADAERALVAIEFFKTRYPEHVLRSIRSLVFRAAPDSRELTLLRAMAIEVVRTLGRQTKSRASAGIDF